MKMNFLDLAKERQSCRKYDINKPVERDKIERCLEAARLAPSACNSQPWYFIVVDNPELCKKVADATFGPVVGFNHFTITAPVMIVIITHPSNIIASIGSKIKGIEYRLIDIGIAAEHFCLQAVSEGLGSCMLGWFDRKAVKKILNIPKPKSVDLIISMGYPADEARDKQRRAINDIRKYNLE